MKTISSFFSSKPQYAHEASPSSPQPKQLSMANADYEAPVSEATALSFQSMCKQLTTKGYAVFQLPPDEANVVRQALQSVSTVLSSHRNQWLMSEQKMVKLEGSPPVRITSDPLRSQLRWAGGAVSGHPLVSESVMEAMEKAWVILERLARDCLHTDPIAEANAEGPRKVKGEACGHIVDVFLYGQRGKGSLSKTPYPMGSHTDRGLLTLVMADCPALEVFDQKWIELPLRADEVAFLAGTGWINSHLNPPFAACNHRVKHYMTETDSTKETPRSSFTFEVRQSAQGWENISSIRQQREELLLAKQSADVLDIYSLTKVLKSLLLEFGRLPLDLINTVLRYMLPFRPTHSMLLNQTGVNQAPLKSLLMQELDDDVRVLILDSGGYQTRVGFGEDTEPKCVFPTIVGRPRHRGVMVGMGKKDSYVGDEAKSKCGILTLKCPIESGLVTNWDDMEKIWHHSFYNELRVAPEENLVLLTEPIFNPKAHREKMVQIMFETFDTPALCIVSQPALAVYSMHLTTGVVIDIRSCFMQVVPVVEGLIVLAAVRSIPLGGHHLTDYLSTLISLPDQENVLNSNEMEAICVLKEKYCYVAMDYENEPVMEQKAECPQGRSITIGKAQFQCPEALFQPSLASVDAESLPSLVCQSISKCELDIQKALWGGIILTGGSSMFPNLHARLLMELKKLAPPSTKISLLPPSKHAPWVGGAVLSTLPCFQSSMLLVKEEYDELGPIAVHQKCS